MNAEEFDYTQWCDSTGAPLAKMPDRLGVAANGFIRDKTGKILLQQRADNGLLGPARRPSRTRRIRRADRGARSVRGNGLGGAASSG